MIMQTFKFLLARVTLCHLRFHNGQEISTVQFLFTDLSQFQLAGSSSPPESGTCLFFTASYHYGHLSVYSNADKIKTTLQAHLTIQSHCPLLFFSETNFNGYCGPPAELTFRSAKVIYGLYEIFSIVSSPELHIKNFHVSHMRHQTTSDLWLLLMRKSQTLST